MLTFFPVRTGQCLLKGCGFLRILKNIMVRSGWADVYNLQTEGGRGRACLLGAALTQGIAGGLTNGVFYTGLLVGYGFDIVNISILSIVPHLASLFSLLSPYILERIRKRRVILTISRILYYAINILGITLLPQLVESNSGRLIGLIAITFLSSGINYLFSPGYTVWHMPYVPPEVRSGYFASVDFATNLSRCTFLLVASLITDRLTGDAQLNLIITLRYASFAIAMLDVFFLQVPKEPEYVSSAARPKLLDIFRLPLSNKKFRLTMLIYGMYHLFTHLPSGLQTWYLEELHASYTYLNVLGGVYAFFVIGTTALWTRFVRKRGTFKSFGIVMLLLGPSYVLFGFVNSNNFWWLLTSIRLFHHFISLMMILPLNNLLYVNTPDKDRTNYMSFHSIVGSTCTFISMSIGTSVIAAMGDSTWNFLGSQLGHVPTLLMTQGVLYLFLGLFVLAIRSKVTPDGAGDL